MAPSIRVLHVDDEPEFADLAATFLERDEELEVLTATDVSAALDVLAETQVDCIVSDYEMPERDGLELLETVREDDEDLPFVLFTGKGSEEIASEAISAGVSDYLQKRSGTDQYLVLANRIKNLVSQSRAERSVERTRQRFRTLVEEATDVILTVNADATVTYASPSAESVLGRTPDELVGSDGFDPVHPEDVDTVMAEFARLVENPDERRTVEFRYRHSDGSWTWVEARGRNLLDDPVVGGIVVYVRDTTARKERELELQRKDRRYRAIFNDPNILVGVLDTDGTVLEINETAMEYVDASHEAVTDWPFWETPWFEHSTEVQDDVKAWIDRAADGEYVEFEADLVTPAGEPYAIEGVFRPVTNDDGEVVSLVVSDREVTERKERERELERIRNFFTEAERLGNLGAWEVDASGDVVWTEGTRRIHEVDDTFEPTVEDGISFFHPDDRDTIRRVVTAALEDGEPFDVEARLRTANDTERWIRTRGNAVDGDGDTVRGYIQDITDQKTREEELRRAKSQLEAAVEAGAVATWEWHVPDDRLVTGPEFARKFGVDPAAARAGVPLERFLPSIHEDDREHVERQIEAALEACGSYETEYRVWNADDELRWVVARGHVECDDEGTPLRFPGALTDITDRKRTERQLERKNDRLDEFASVVSHDLQNPLRVASGHLELAKEECASDHLDAVERAHDRMGSLIDELLALAREGETIEAVTSVDLAELAETCWTSVETAEATLTLELDRTIRADEGRLRHVFENLFNNAVEHGGRSVTVTVGSVPDGFYVEDDGSGLPEDGRGTIFDAGYTTSEDGTGVGLSIVRRIVETHGWDVRVTEGSDGGARFEITGVDADG